MRGKVCLLCLLLLGTFLALSWGRAQNSPKGTPPSPAGKPAFQELKTAKRDLSKRPLLERQAYLSGQRGAGWLGRANYPDGRFWYGYLPSLHAPMEGDNYLQQVGGAFALARAARYYGDEKAAAIARQAILTLLLATTVDPKSTEVRYTALPGALVNRLAAAGMLVLAIHELPAPGKDLLDQSSQLCNYIRRQQRADGSLSCADKELGAKADEDTSNYYPGPALYALTRSAKHLPAPWKTEVVTKATAHYSKWWREHKNPAMVPWHTAACTEAYLATRDQAMADAVFEMNDWLCGLQYQQLDPRRPLWLGGFKSWRDGREALEAPEVASAAYAESLAEACRAARQAGDVRRHERYKEALERCLPFLATLQYTDANTQHFAEWYRPVLVGAFHASHQDGNLRLDYTARAVSAMVQYLEHVASQN